MSIIVAGGGIAGLAFALSSHEIGEDVTVYEAAQEIKPLGVGINLQPNAVRELYQMGMADDLKKIGIEAEEWALYYYGAHPVWSEPRGTKAGYRWPQYSVHRGQFHLRLLERVRERLGDQSVISDARLTHFENFENHVTAHFINAAGDRDSREADLLVGADGIHSSVRQQMHPDQGDVHWGGAVMWRGVSRCAPPKSKNAFILIGSIAQRFICYPVEPLDASGQTSLNWIAELRPKDRDAIDQSDWNKPAVAGAFIDKFKDWRFDWLDVPDIVAKAEGIWEFPMIDRDPIDRWSEQRVVLIGDAAHAMFPHGSNGASQAIVDGRILASHIQSSGPTTLAIQEYETRMLEKTNELILRNRGEGPVGVLVDIDERLSHGKSLDVAIDRAEIANYMARYKEAAGFSRDILNAADPIIPV